LQIENFVAVSKEKNLRGKTLPKRMKKLYGEIARSKQTCAEPVGNLPTSDCRRSPYKLTLWWFSKNTVVAIYSFYYYSGIHAGVSPG